VQLHLLAPFASGTVELPFWPLFENFLIDKGAWTAKEGLNSKAGSCTYYLVISACVLSFWSRPAKADLGIFVPLRRAENS
jgi:hypothetical protein